MEPVTIIALGTGREEDLTLGALRAMREAGRLILRTARCGAAGVLDGEKIPYETLDDLYETAEDFDELNRLSAERILEAAEKEKVCFAVFDPAQDGAVRLIRSAVGRVIPGVSMGTRALSAVLPQGERRVLAAADLDTVSSQGTLCLTEIDTVFLAGECKMKLSEFYAPDTPVWFFPQDGGAPARIPLEDLDRQKVARYGHLCAAVIPERDVTEKKRNDFGDLKRVMDALLAENGCPWDREQTHRSLRNYLVEEAYETAAAIDGEEWDHAAEELGDVLLQVVFQAAIGRAYGTFDLGDVTTAITRKMIRRHPHVFGQADAADSGAVTRNWDRIKREERGFDTVAQTLRDLPRTLPPLMRSAKAQERAARAGADIPLDAALDRLRAVTDRLRSGAAKGWDGEERKREAEEMIGETLFLCVVCARKAGVNAEVCLESACERFVKRFESLENAAPAGIAAPGGLTIDEFELYFNNSGGHKGPAEKI